MLNTLVKIPVVLGDDWAWRVKFNLFSKSCLFASLLSLWNICETCKKRMKQSLFHILNSYAHICSPTEMCHGPWNSRIVSLVWPFLASIVASNYLQGPHRESSKAMSLTATRGGGVANDWRWLCWLPNPRLGDWQWIFACFFRLSTNHAYLTCWNFVCQHSVMAETIVKQRAFAFISCSISKIGLSRFV